MTEPLLLGSDALWRWRCSLKWCDDRARRDAHRVRQPCVSAWVFALACLTRYEAWPVTAARARRGGVGAVAARDRPSRRRAPRRARLPCIPRVAVAGFFVFSRVVIGAWFVASGFFVPENKALGLAAGGSVGDWLGRPDAERLGAARRRRGGPARSSCLALATRAMGACPDRRRAAGTAALPWVGLSRGPSLPHPLHGAAHRRRGVSAAASRPVSSPRVCVWSSPSRCSRWSRYELRPLDARAPMVVEAQWDQPNVPAARRVTGCLGAGLPDETIMASMGSLGHYMQETSRRRLSASAIFCTKATATSGWRRSPTDRAPTRIGC